MGRPWNKQRVAQLKAIARIRASPISACRPRRRGSVADEIIVALTSYPARIDGVWLAVRSLLHQKYRADRLVLVLSRDEFPGLVLPRRLQTLTRHGLTIMWVEGNIRSYKKLLPVLKDNPEAIIVTADDDALYPSWWLDSLIAAHLERPRHILAHRANRILLNANCRPEPYLEWSHATTQTPSVLVFPTGVGGVLYPPQSLPQQVLDAALALRLCPTTDDIWFRVMAFIAGTPVGVVSDAFQEFVTIPRTQHEALIQLNVEEGQNDADLRRALDHFGLWGKFECSLPPEARARA
jgi:hypothetical protein